MFEALKNIMNVIFGYYTEYCGNSKMMILFFACLVVIACSGREYRIKVLYPTFFLGTILFNPVIYLYVFSKVLGYAYWRSMWLIPVVPVISTGILLLLRCCKKKAWKVCIAILSTAIILCSGCNIYIGKKQFVIATNAYKIPQKVIDIEEAVFELTDKPKAIVPSDLYCYTRQYKSEFKQIYGRDADNFIASIWKYGDTATAYLVDSQLGDDSFKRFMYMEKKGCNVVVNNNVTEEKLLATRGYQKEKQLCGKSIYYNSNIDEKGYRFVISQRGYDDNHSRMGYVIEGTDNRLAIVDGCFADLDRWMTSSYIERHNNYVNDWFLTSIDPGHVSAFMAYYKENKVRIDRIYVPVYDEKDRLVAETNYYEDFYNCIKNDSRVIYYDDGMQGDILGIEFEIVARGDNATCFSLNGRDESILFCSDLTNSMKPGIQDYLKTHTFDYLQMTVHDNMDFPWEIAYEVDPKMILLDCSSVRINTMPEEFKEQLAMLKEVYDVYDYSHLPNIILFD